MRYHYIEVRPAQSPHLVQEPRPEAALYLQPTQQMPLPCCAGLDRPSWLLQPTQPVTIVAPMSRMPGLVQPTSLLIEEVDAETEQGITLQFQNLVAGSGCGAARTIRRRRSSDVLRTTV